MEVLKERKVGQRGKQKTKPTRRQAFLIQFIKCLDGFVLCEGTKLYFKYCNESLFKELQSQGFTITITN